MRAMQTPLGRTLLIIGGGLGFLLLASASAALIALTLFLVRRSRVGQPTRAVRWTGSDWRRAVWHSAGA
jgi:hypothetical protein